MLFKEIDYLTLKLNDYPKSFIYFLIKNEEVIYIGQTQKGLYRIFNHKDKEFDSVKIIEIINDKLDDAETYFILKYKPTLNKTLPPGGAISLQTLKNIIFDAYKKKVNIPDIRKLLKKANIQIISFQDMDYVLRENCDYLIYEYMERGD